MDSETISIFSYLCGFLLAHKTEITTKVIASATYDVLKQVLDFSSLKQKIKQFFNGEEEVDDYLKTICNDKPKDKSDPHIDIKYRYEELTGRKYSDDLYKEIQSWIEQNEKQIIRVSKMEFKNEKGFNIGIQNASKSIFNIQGDYNPPKK